MEERVVLVKTVGKTLRAEYQRVAPVGNAALEIETYFCFSLRGESRKTLTALKSTLNFFFFFEAVFASHVFVSVRRRRV